MKKLLIVSLVFASFYSHANSQQALDENVIKISYECEIDIELKFAGREANRTASDKRYVEDIENVISSHVFNFMKQSTQRTKLYAQRDLIKSCIELANVYSNESLSKLNDRWGGDFKIFATPLSSLGGITRDKVMLGSDNSNLSVASRVDERVIEHQRFCKKMIQDNMVCEEVREVVY